MDRERGMQIAQRLWSENKYALYARSSLKARDLWRDFSTDGMDLFSMAEKIESIMAMPEKNLEYALGEAWAHLEPHVGAEEQKVVEGLIISDIETARWLVCSLAEKVSDSVVASSRLFDHPVACRRIWVRDNLGPTMYEIRSREALRIPPAEVGQLLVDTFRDTAWRILRMVIEKPVSPVEIEEKYGTEGLKVLDACHRLLVLRRIAGHYRPRGIAVSHILTGLGR